MKKIILITLLYISFITITYSQENKSLKIYSVGVGVGSEHDVGNFGFYITNDIKFFFTNRLAINPRLNFFQSTVPFGGFVYEDPITGQSVNDPQNYTALFIDLGLSYNLINKKFYSVSLNVGPCYEIGKETHIGLRSYHNDILDEERIVNNQIRLYGAFADLEMSVKLTDKIYNSVVIKSNHFWLYPEFLGVVYKVGFSF